MENYKELGNRYLNKNKRRSILTVIGCALVAALLFAFLNTMTNWLVKYRADVRAEDDFEILVLTDDVDVLQGIVNEDFVVSAYLGKAYSWRDDDENTIYANALHINVNNVMLIKYYRHYIEETYNVKTEGNMDLMWTYLQDDEGLGYVLILATIFVAYVFAIIGVGIIRNSTQISAMERIKDYGNLRCIGATRKQVRAIVFRETVIVETIGIALGIIAGYLISIPICSSFEFPMRFHILPVLFLGVAFYGDMYFAIGDGIKQVLKVNPIEAVRGNYRVRNRRIRKVNSGIWKLIFGIEGDYAYKNIKRNNGRFIKTVGSMAFGIATVFVIGGVAGTLARFLWMTNSIYGYYQEEQVGDISSIGTTDEIKASTYSADAIRVISQTNGISDVKYLYADTVYMVENGWVAENLTDDYYNDTFESTLYKSRTNERDKQFLMEESGEETPALKAWREAHPDDGDYPWEKYEKGREIIRNSRAEYRRAGLGLVDYSIFDPKEGEESSLDSAGDAAEIFTEQLDLYGYDEEDYQRITDALVEGTTDLSENGVILVNRTELTRVDDFSEDYVMNEFKTFDIMNVKVGDEVEIVDPAKLYILVQEELERAREHDQKIMALSEEWEKAHPVDESGENTERNPYEDYTPVDQNQKTKSMIINGAREKLIEDGDVIKLKIEGIASDPNRRVGGPSLVVPLDRYFEITGKAQDEYSGFKFHVSNIFSSDISKDAFMNAYTEKMGEYGLYVSTGEYIYAVSGLANGIKQFLLVGAVILVIVLASAFTTMYVSISNLQLRRKELAQLRAIGMTKKSLMKSVVLEGGIVWIISVILGSLLGLTVEYMIYEGLTKYLFRGDMYIFWPAVIILAALELAVLCGTNYFCLKSMRLDVAEELIQSGE